MVLRSFARVFLCLLMLLVAGNVTSAILAAPGGEVKFQPTHGLAAADGVLAPHRVHSNHALDVDAPHLSSWRLRTVQILPCCTFLLAVPLLLIPWGEKDLLSLTQRRRE